MRKFVFVALAGAMLSGCLSTLDSAYDERARDDCERETSGAARGECLDRVDQNRRERRD